MATQRNTQRSSSGSPAPSVGSISRDLPPPRRSRALKPVSLPLEQTSLRKLIYTLVILTTALTAFYSYRTVQHKNAVGGWWNLALGRKYPQVRTQEEFRQGYEAGSGGGRHEGVEGKIVELAGAFGMPPHELASAIAVAVRNYVPPASLSSIAAQETGKLVKVLLEGDESGEKVSTKSDSGEDSSATGVVEGVVHGVEYFVGMDEP
ncbi:hypothetical protein FA15DRAFT_676195 [Coprinopsis marcescibilis]|uniref:Uncharacterized protein n=1 Tax=Coprinopsis marcescibilis TaxID=230819 RepID=A0A5C3KAY7_COPMA|nr:hypothetical protein FA15DRAFT_676195 [Coprinopsis marcescibilis]